MTFSDDSMASCGSWVFWTFVRIVFNGGRLLRQFGNMYYKLKEDVTNKSCCSYGFCPNYLHPLPHWDKI